MTTECNGKPFEFHPLDKREVRAGFEGGAITSDGGGLLLREIEKRTAIVERFAACFRDHREAERVEHTVRELVAQRVYGLAVGWVQVTWKVTAAQKEWAVRPPNAPFHKVFTLSHWLRREPPREVARLGDPGPDHIFPSADTVVCG